MIGVLKIKRFIFNFERPFYPIDCHLFSKIKSWNIKRRTLEQHLCLGGKSSNIRFRRFYFKIANVVVNNQPETQLRS